MNKNILIVGTVIVIIAVIGAFFVLSNQSNNNSNNTNTNTSSQSNNQSTSNNSSTNTSNSSDEERCIITVNGSKYDLTEFRKMHEGGDIFVCGTDMTARFRGEHGGDYARLEPYRVK